MNDECHNEQHPDHDNRIQIAIFDDGISANY
jgi:hypothetical protein